MKRSILILVVALLAGVARAGEEEAERGWLGVQVRELDEGARAELGWDRDGGILLEAVVEGSPAARVGLKPGDVLFRVGKERLANVESLMEMMSGTRPGQKVGFAAWREGKAFEGQIELGRLPAETVEEREPIGPDEARRRIYRHLEELTEALLEAAREGAPDRIRELVGAIREASMEAAHLELRLFEAERVPHPAEERKRAAAKGQIEVLRLAMHAMMEADRHDLAQALERKVHAMEIALAGRRDPEAMEIMRNAPGTGDMGEILNHAAELYRKFEMPEKAEACARLGRQYLERAQAEGGDRLDKVIKELERLKEEVRTLREARGK